MQLNALERQVQLNVRELANFRNAPEGESIPGGGQWRASVGQQWHKTAQEQSLLEYPDAQFELSLQASIREHDWQFEINGRIDQLLPLAEHELRLREVKTVQTSLPHNSADLRLRYPDYFAQIAIYLAIARQQANYRQYSLSAELQFINITDGTVQIEVLNAEDEALFQQQLDRILPFLNDRRDARLRLQNICFSPAFETLREGQAELLETLHDASLKASTVLLEAPTGFGKTGIALQHALEQMKSGLFDRCIYLSSKSTGQLQTIQQLRTMLNDQLRYIQMRNREEHQIDSAKHQCTGDTHCDDKLTENWFNADLHAPDLFDGPTLELARAKELGAETGVCPYSLTRACLPFSEFWIGDLNYVFSPSSQSVFSAPYGFDPAKTLLIIDEAHNLPERCAKKPQHRLQDKRMDLRDRRATREPCQSSLDQHQQ